MTSFDDMHVSYDSNNDIIEITDESIDPENSPRLMMTYYQLMRIYNTVKEAGRVTDSEWIITFTGKRFYPLKPNPDDICIEDIAHALSCKVRFSGHTDRFYSVADHSIAMVRHQIKQGETATFTLLGTLLHDASEAYLPDIASPLRSAFPDFDTAETHLTTVILKKFNALYSESAMRLDKEICIEELAVFLNYGSPKGSIKLHTSPTPDATEKTFLYMARELLERRIP